MCSPWVPSKAPNLSRPSQWSRDDTQTPSMISRVHIRNFTELLPRISSAKMVEVHQEALILRRDLLLVVSNMAQTRAVTLLSPCRRKLMIPIWLRESRHLVPTRVMRTHATGSRRGWLDQMQAETMQLVLRQDLIFALVVVSWCRTPPKMCCLELAALLWIRARRTVYITQLPVIRFQALVA